MDRASDHGLAGGHASRPADRRPLGGTGRQADHGHGPQRPASPAGEILGAAIAGSLVLLADAAHMAADAAGVGLSLLAVALRQPGRATARRTFGYARAEILAAMTNAVLLLGLAAFIIVDAIQRLMSPPSVESGLVIVYGVVALGANAVSLLLLRRGQAESLNLRGAFLEVASDRARRPGGHRDRDSDRRHRFHRQRTRSPRWRSAC